MRRWLRPRARSDQDPAEDSRRGVGGTADPDRSGREPPTATRRESLLAAGGLLGVAGCGRGRPSSDRSAVDVDAAGFGSRTAGDGREDFLWIGAGLWANERRFLENMLASARRRDLAVLFGQPPSNAPGVGETVRPALEAARSFGVDAWFNLGVLRDVPPAEFLGDEDRRERHLAGLREVARVYDDLVDGGRIVCWQEAPVIGRWAESGTWNQESVDNLLEHGPAVFEAQKAALVDANPSLDVGLFVHFPYLVDSKRPDVFAALAASLRDRGATPDFGFTDYYRGWYEKDVGPDRADAAVRSLIANASEHLGGADVFYLGQAHTIDPGHTPNKQTVRSTLRVALEAGAAGVGWYMRNDYTPTEHGFDPFVPTPADAEVRGGPVTTATVARDRYRYAWAATLDSRSDVVADDRFDLWVHGDGFPFYTHRISARTADGEWVVLGDVGGYLDGDHRYARGRTAVIGALERDRYLDDGVLELRLETDRDADPASLTSVHAMPWDPRNFVTELEATTLLEGPADVAAHELGRASPETALQPGAVARLTVPVEGDGRASLAPLVHPEHVEAVRRLADAEERASFDPSVRFDCWITGSGLDGRRDRALPSLVAADGERVSPADACVVAVASSDVALCYGLPRDDFLADRFEMADDGRADVDAAYAMPYAGSGSFRSPERAATLLSEQPAEADRFAVAQADRSSTAGESGR